MAQAPIIRRKPKISRSDARDLILSMTAFGDHKINIGSLGIHDLRQIPSFFQARGIDFDELVERCRDPQKHVPFFENIIRSRWNVSGDGIAMVNRHTGEEVHRVKGAGVLSTSTYWSYFEDAYENYNSAIDEASPKHFVAAVSDGMSSIEAFLAFRAQVWNDAHPDDRLIDSKHNKVSLDDKIKEWFPKMNGGTKLNKSIVNWRNFKILRGIRDRKAHPKDAVFSVSYEELVKNLNLFRAGIAGILVQLHMPFYHRIPIVILRCHLGPEVELVAESETPVAAKT